MTILLKKINLVTIKDKKLLQLIILLKFFFYVTQILFLQFICGFITYREREREERVNKNINIGNGEEKREKKKKLCLLVATF